MTIEISNADKWLSRDEAALYLRTRHHRRCQSSYLAKLAWQGGGPLFFKQAGSVVYRPSDLDAWVELRNAANGPYQRSSVAPPCAA